ncbi:uncharacterized protein V6R79_020410 [Siganus canaliculatus]
MGDVSDKLSAAKGTRKAGKMRAVVASCALAALLLAVAWADHHIGHHGHDGHDGHHDDHASCLKLSPPNADFAFALYRNLKSKAAAGSNIFFSPLGISTALSLVSAGAGGATHSQLFSSLGYSAHDQAHVNEAYQHLFHMLGDSQKEQTLVLGNAAAVRSGFSPNQKFLDVVKNSYSGEVLDVDFAQSKDAVDRINRLIADKTENKIQDQVKELDPDTAMVLINYILFRGQWEKPFNHNRTTKAPFHVDETTTVEVDMMVRTGRYDLYQDADNHTTVIRLPYKGNTSLLVVLPEEGKMKEVEDYINKDYIRHWHRSLYRNSVDLYLPKFSISTDTSLENTLKELGITNAFEDTADFSGISEEQKLKISKVSQKAVLSVDETGTEAAASTTIEVMPMSMPETIKLDRPFLAFILEHSTKSILFMGQINNPAA